MPRNPLQLVSCKMTSKRDPLRTLGSALTSATAISIADLADLPIVELDVNKAPIFTVLGCAMDDIRSVERRERRRRRRSGERTKPIYQKLEKRGTKIKTFQKEKQFWKFMELNGSFGLKERTRETRKRLSQLTTTGV